MNIKPEKGRVLATVSANNREEALSAIIMLLNGVQNMQLREGEEVVLRVLTDEKEDEAE